MRELSVAEQRHEAVRAVIADGETVTDVAARFVAVFDQTDHRSTAGPARTRRSAARVHCGSSGTTQLPSSTRQLGAA